ncbi:MAG: SocA family protein [Cellulomonadaceae bacterium]|jgi:uncharacterized phage-associated protein|nr:SocA family protein [Cellulomonadaceae bacterium]
MIDYDKYANLILLLCRELGGFVAGKKKLAKLLYYIDFDRYEYHESMRTVTGDIYRARPMGPVPNRYLEVVSTLERDGKLNRRTRSLGGGYHPQEIYVAQTSPDISVFDEDDMAVISRVVHKYGNLDGKQLETLTHAEAPWAGTAPDDVIGFELAFYRGTVFDDALAVT